jgi:long-subunit acyl-CoA synthetase (AMP-forming)
MAAAHLGLGSLFIYPNSTADVAAGVIADARCRVLVTERSFLDRALQDRASVAPRLHTIVRVDGGNETTLSWQELIECQLEEFDLGAAAAAVTPDDLLTVVYSFAPGGPPTLVRLTHADVIARIRRLRKRLPLREGWRVISWHPIADIAERLCTPYLPLVHGWQVTSCADPSVLAASLPEIRPEFFWARPTLWREMRASVLARFHGDPDHATANRAAVLTGLGLDQVRIALVAASCPPDVVSFWRALGVPLNNEELCSQ